MQPKALDTFHVLSECSGLWKERKKFFGQLANRLEKTPNSKTVVDILRNRIKYEHEKYEGQNDPEEKSQELYPMQTSAVPSLWKGNVR